MTKIEQQNRIAFIISELNDGKSYVEIGKQLKISRQCVQQIIQNNHILLPLLLSTSDIIDKYHISYSRASKAIKYSGLTYNTRKQRRKISSKYIQKIEEYLYICPKCKIKKPYIIKNKCQECKYITTQDYRQILFTETPGKHRKNGRLISYLLQYLPLSMTKEKLIGFTEVARILGISNIRTYWLIKRNVLTVIPDITRLHPVTKQPINMYCLHQVSLLKDLLTQFQSQKQGEEVEKCV